MQIKHYKVSYWAIVFEKIISTQKSRIQGVEYILNQLVATLLEPNAYT